MRFEEVVLSSSTTGASAASARPSQPAASVANRSLVASTASETDGLLDALPQVRHFLGCAVLRTSRYYMQFWGEVCVIVVLKWSLIFQDLFSEYLQQ